MGQYLCVTGISLTYIPSNTTWNVLPTHTSLGMSLTPKTDITLQNKSIYQHTPISHTIIIP